MACDLEADALPPGTMFPHMRLAPTNRADMVVAGPCRWSGPPLLCPPDGLCFLYSWLAALCPEEWAAVEKDDHGFIYDAEEEQIWKTKARSLLDQVLALMEAEGQGTMAQRLRAGGYPGDEEFGFYTRALGGAFLVTPVDEPNAVACIHGEGPVHCELGFVYSVDAAGGSAGHYILLQSWAPVPSSDKTAPGEVACQYSDTAPSAEAAAAKRGASPHKPTLSRTQPAHHISLDNSDTDISPASPAGAPNTRLDSGSLSDRSSSFSLFDPRDDGSPMPSEPAYSATDTPNRQDPQLCDTNDAQKEDDSSNSSDSRKRRRLNTQRELQTSPWATAATAFGNTTRILKIRRHWLNLILSGQKAVEIRGGPCPHVGWVTLAEVGSKKIVARARLGSSHRLTDEESRANSEALGQLSYTDPWAWPIDAVESLPNPIEIPSWVAQGCVQWISRARWEAFDATCSAPQDTGDETAAPATAPLAMKPTHAEPCISDGACEGPSAAGNPDEAAQRQKRSRLVRLRRTRTLPSITYAEPPGRKRSLSDLCSGSDDAPCVFNMCHSGLPARRVGTSLFCTWCDESALRLAAATPSGRGKLTRALKAFRLSGNRRVYSRALERLRRCTPAHAATIERQAAKDKRAKPGLSSAQLQTKACKRQEQWVVCKTCRQAVAATATPEIRKAYRAAVLADQRFAKNRFFPGTERRKRAKALEMETLPDNDCDLPPTSRSATSVALQRWCEEGAWGMCSTCQILQPRPLRPQDLCQNSSDPQVPPSGCRRCNAKYAHVVPCPADVPQPLRYLSPAIVAALRPLAIDVGRETRAQNGYRKKVRMITFAWEMEAVTDKIRRLQREDRHTARNALKHLLQSSDSMYSHFYERQRQFLERHRTTPQWKKRAVLCVSLKNLV